MKKTLIERIELASNAASITFSSIPADYTDLLVKLSFRSTGTAAYDPILLRFNGSDTGYSGRVLETSVGFYTTSEVVTTATSAQATGTWARITGTGVSTDGHTANTYGNAQILIPSYRSSAYKSVSCDTVGENNATQAPLEITANLWSNTAVITSLSLALKDGFIKQYSSASLYGITAGNDGITTVS
jgi:hypothetical protein